MKLQGHARTLVSLYTKHKETSFEWGTFDCCIWAGTVIDKITLRPESILSSWDFTYTTKAQAFSQLSERGYEGLADLADNYFTQTPINYSMRGDLVLADDFFAINYGDRLIGVGEGGLISIPLQQATLTWRVE